MNDLTADELLQAIEDSRVLDPNQKRLLVNIFPKLTPAQRTRLTAFFARENQELASVEEKYQKEKAPIYKEYLAALNQAFAKAEHLIAREAEKGSREKEQEEIDGLMSQI